MKTLNIDRFFLLLSFCLGFTVSSYGKDLMDCTYQVKVQYTREGEVINGFGTGVAVDLKEFGIEGRNFIFTAAHVVIDDKTADKDIEVYIKSKLGWTLCNVLFKDETLDIAILESLVDLKDNVILDTEKDLPLGTKLKNISCPRGEKARANDGTLLNKKGHTWSADAKDFDSGSSGSPIFKEEKLAGLAIAGPSDKDGNLIPGTACFIPVKIIKHFIRDFIEEREKVK